MNYQLAFATLVPVALALAASLLTHGKSTHRLLYFILTLIVFFSFQEIAYQAIRRLTLDQFADANAIVENAIQVRWVSDVVALVFGGLLAWRLHRAFAIPTK